LLETLDDITKMAANNKQIDIILLDFSKAFDKSAAQKTVKQAKLLWHSQQHTALDAVFLSPFLNRGTMCACNQSLGSLPCSKDVWNRKVIAGVSSSASSLHH
jgi:DNA modification methylase